MSRRLVVAATVTALSLTVVPAYAASQGATPAHGTPAATPTRFTATPSATKQGTKPSAPTGSAPSAPKPTTPPPPPAPYTPPKDSGDAVAATAARITTSSHFAVKADPAGKQAMDATWPDAGTLFTAAELSQILPGVTAVQARDCAGSPVTGGRASAHSTRCTLVLSMKGEPHDNQSRLMVSIRGFGVPATVGQAWAKSAVQQRERSADRPGLYTFYRNGSLGATAAYTDGTTTRVLLQGSGVAGEIWFSGIGFAHVRPSYLASRHDYRQRIVPALVQLLGAKMQPAA
ncbi:hypothetical protein [Luteipulveratus flavus]|uniref:Uncharacterized protein n=1 Tax=Luteipulveratus flavus TaxID=3031728 RepID=A0ABT6C2A5_9MICO|nr:hypothetical protein [Luteipulveratus sp. YIM 133296]MDF8262883.1 hypothetical protein [Luteipulveratus sp. YIM 133296]